jgi:hypothetical protein
MTEELSEVLEGTVPGKRRLDVTEGKRLWWSGPPRIWPSAMLHIDHHRLLDFLMTLMVGHMTTHPGGIFGVPSHLDNHWMQQPAHGIPSSLNSSPYLGRTVETQSTHEKVMSVVPFPTSTSSRELASSSASSHFQDMLVRSIESRSPTAQPTFIRTLPPRSQASVPGIAPHLHMYPMVLIDLKPRVSMLCPVENLPNHLISVALPIFNRPLDMEYSQRPPFRIRLLAIQD